MTEWWQQRSIRIATYLSIAFVLYAVLMAWALPKWASSKLPELVAQHTNAKLTIGAIKIDPLRWRLQIDNTTLSEADDQTIFALTQAVVNLDPWRSLFTLTPHVHELTFTEPHLAVINRDGQLNLQALLPTSTGPEPTPDNDEAATEPQPIPLVIDKIAVNQGSVHFTQNQQAPLKFEQLTLAGEQLNLASDDNRLNLSFNGPNGGTLNLGLSSQLTPLRVDAKLQLQQAQLPPFWQVADLPLPLELDSGTLSLNSHITIAQQQQLLTVQVQQSDLTLAQLQLSHQQQPLLAADKITLDGIELSWPQQQLDMAALAFEGGFANAQLTETGLDWLALLPAAEANPQEQADTEPAVTEAATEQQPWQVKLGQADITGWQLALLDHTAAEPVRWQLDIDQLKTGVLSQDLSAAIDIDFAARLNQNTPITIATTLVPQPLSVDSEFSLTALPLALAEPYWREQVAMTMRSGEAELKGTLQLQQTEPLALILNANTAISKLELVEAQQKQQEQQQPLLAWQRLSVDGIELDTSRDALQIAKIHLDGLQQTLARYADGDTNLGKLLVSRDDAAANESDNSSEADDANESAPNPLLENLKINQIVLSNSQISLSDSGVSPAVNTQINAINATVDTLGKPYPSTPFSLSAKVDDYAPLSIDGAVEAENSRVTVGFEQFEMNALTPYTNQYLGYALDQGQLQLGLDYQLNGNQLHGDNNITLKQLKLGARSDSEQATTLPIGLAIALMQDSNGNIELALPIDGNIDDPTFAIGPLLGDAFGKVITKVATAPFSLLGSLLPGGAEPAQFVAFDAGDNRLSDQAKAELQQLAKAIKQRPKLMLRLRGAINPNTDQHQLAKQQLVELLGGEPLTEQQWQQLRQRAELKLGKEAVDKVVAELSQENQWQQALYQQLINAEEINPELLQALAQQRARNAQQWLISEGEISANQVQIAPAAATVDKRGARVQLELDASQAQ